ncbi:MAG: hypothetical protein J0M08_03880 [Bacteroidetes bacterium]|nr:hypothetical protein [Bacteroidota bacterium]
MIKKIIYIVIIFLTFGCENSNSLRPDQINSDNLHFDKIPKENSLEYDTSEVLWDYTFDTITSVYKPTKLRVFLTDTLSEKTIEKIVNKTWPKVQVKYLRTSHDTVFIKIPNSTVLTQQMGTTGADQFMVSTTYSFTELKGIKFVAYDFEFGDHANPGVYNRNSWDNR